MRKVLRACALVACVLTTACGGGGGGSSSPTVPDNGSTPVPTPTPTPAPTYDIAFDFSRDRSFQAQGAELRVINRYDSGANSTAHAEAIGLNIQPDESKISIVYAATPRTLTLSYGDDVSRYTPDANTVNDATTLRYVIVQTDTQRGDAVTLSPGQLASGNTQYVLIGQQDLSSAYQDGNPGTATLDIQRRLIAGSATVASDVPTTGTSLYHAAGTGSIPNLIRAGASSFQTSGDVSIDHAKGKITATLPFAQPSAPVGQPPISLTLTFTGTVGSDGRANGTISTADSSYTGLFNGRLYGPGGVEFGFVLTLTGANGNRIVGSLYGRRG